ncbi:hypothetical protein [Profundibacterium mesophilum]|uniref:O-antigen ligase like membrane proteindomain containing protein n=1 Tax=Profundibacterium mesophilum KAUST100406-0324 TaxID=1037889 RepID=A0A921TDL0_9RHOB|nr:hypothetical protein [Profundibacterium mesophilum]KAF0676933.1 O-antigen ligase like membrane proteindomain containing protein [Profundibacterium mesophilum KAUST100406-0324]
MQLLPSTVLAVIAIVILALRGPRRGLWAFMALTPFGAAAAFNLPAVGGASIGLKELAVVAIFALVALTPGGPNRLAGSMRPGGPGFALAALLLYAVLVTMFAPTVFRGETEVFSISRSANESGIVSIPLRPGTGNITQLFYMVLAALGFFALAAVFRVGPDAGAVVLGMAVATAVNFALGWLDVLSFAAGLEALMEPIRTANYAMLIDHRMVGLKRMIGGFPEASSFGDYSLGLFAFWLQFWIAGPRGRLAGVMLLLSMIVLLRSTSSGAYVSLVLFLLAYGAPMVLSGTRRHVARHAASIVFAVLVAGWLAALALFASYELVDPVTAFFDRAIFDKLGTQSGVERMSWNAQAFRNFLDTSLLGAGMGSVRASNWLLASLACLGLIGTALYLWFLVLVLRAPAPRGDGQGAAVLSGLKAACVAMFLNALLTAASPNLGVFFFALAGLAAGLSRGAAAVGFSAAAPAAGGAIVPRHARG